jgi:hypothetical protein
MGYDEIRCITTVGHNWWLGTPSKMFQVKLDIRKPKGRVILLDTVARMPPLGTKDQSPRTKLLDPQPTKQISPKVERSLGGEMSLPEMAGD